MSPESIRKQIADCNCGLRRQAAMPSRCAVRLCLTVAHFRIPGGYASHSTRVSLNAKKMRGLVNGIIALLFLSQVSSLNSLAQKRRVPPGGRVAVVVDERLSALRAMPDLRARLIERLSRGRLVSIRGERVSDGLRFYRVAVTRRTSGWVQSEALVAPWHQGDDRRLLVLIEDSAEFDRIVRARTFLDTFPRSLLNPRVLMLYANEADQVAVRLSRDAQRRFARLELTANGAPEYSYYLNYNGLDRYNRQGVSFTFDRSTKQFHYDGAAWRELLRRYPRSPEAAEAKRRLAARAAFQSRVQSPE
jgi:hypothetical protein